MRGRVAEQRRDRCVSAAPTQVWQAAWRYALRTVRRFVGNLHDAQDLAAESLSIAFQRFGNALPVWGELRAWLRRVLRNLVATFCRISLSVRLIALDEVHLAFGQPASTSPTIDDLRRTASPTLMVTLDLLVLGASDVEIALTRRISVRSVRAHRAKLAECVAHLR